MKSEMERIRPNLPEGVDVIIGYDESLFISQSIYEVEHALMIALVLVIGVIFLFLLRSARPSSPPSPFRGRSSPPSSRCRRWLLGERADAAGLGAGDRAGGR